MQYILYLRKPIENKIRYVRNLEGKKSWEDFFFFYPCWKVFSVDVNQGSRDRNEGVFLLKLLTWPVVRCRC